MKITCKHWNGPPPPPGAVPKTPEHMWNLQILLTGEEAQNIRAALGPISSPSIMVALGTLSDRIGRDGLMRDVRVTTLSAFIHKVYVSVGTHQ
jgi:hypothetical protein